MARSCVSVLSRLMKVCREEGYRSEGERQALALRKARRGRAVSMCTLLLLWQSHGSQSRREESLRLRLWRSNALQAKAWKEAIEAREQVVKLTHGSAHARLARVGALAEGDVVGDELRRGRVPPICVIAS